MLDDVQQPSLFVGRGSATPQNAQTIALANGRPGTVPDLAHQLCIMRLLSGFHSARG